MQELISTLVKLDRINSESMSQLIARLRSMKQMELDLLVLEFDEKLSFEDISQQPKDLLAWSKLGQRLCRYISASPFHTIAVLRESTTLAEMEIALACDFIETSTRDINFEMPKTTCFGTKRRLDADAYQNVISRKLINRKQLIEKLSSKPRFSRRLEKHSEAEHPLNIHQAEFLEATIYANQPYARILSEKVSFHGGVYEINQNPTEQFMLDDLGNDYMQFHAYPDNELTVLERKKRLEEVEKLLNQNVAKISGRCVELGSGYGYFAALASKSPSVTESIGIDISTTELYYFGPFMWDVIKPDWNKLSFIIGDMNNLSEDLGEFDTVIFCASLHHSSDIPKSLFQANKLLKPGGTLIIHGEHYDPVFFAPKSRKGSKQLHTIPQFSRALKQSGLTPKVFRYALSGGNRPALRKLLFTKWPFYFVNGWARIASFMMLAKKPK